MKRVLAIALVCIFGMPVHSDEWQYKRIDNASHIVVMETLTVRGCLSYRADAQLLFACNTSDGSQIKLGFLVRNCSLNWPDSYMQPFLLGIGMNNLNRIENMILEQGTYLNQGGQSFFGTPLKAGPFFNFLVESEGDFRFNISRLGYPDSAVFGQFKFSKDKFLAQYRQFPSSCRIPYGG